MKRQAIVLLLTGVVCSGAPVPSIISRPDIWTLDTRCQGLWSIRIPGLQSPDEHLLYLIISIENNTDRDVELVGVAELATDDFRVIQSTATGPGVFEQIKERHRHLYPFLERWPVGVERIMPGPDHAKDYCIIWPQVKPDPGGVTIFIGGLSNEMTLIDHPVERDRSGLPKKVLLRKTLRIEAIIGSPEGRLVGTDWVMR